MPMLWSGGRADKISNKLAGDVACLGGSMVEHQPRLLGSRVWFPAGAFAIFSVSAKASLPISLSLSPFPSSSFPFPSPSDLSFALKNASSHLSHELWAKVDPLQFIVHTPFFWHNIMMWEKKTSKIKNVKTLPYTCETWDLTLTKVCVRLLRVTLTLSASLPWTTCLFSGWEIHTYHHIRTHIHMHAHTITTLINKYNKDQLYMHTKAEPMTSETDMLAPRKMSLEFKMVMAMGGK